MVEDHAAESKLKAVGMNAAHAKLLHDSDPYYRLHVSAPPLEEPPCSVNRRASFSARLKMRVEADIHRRMMRFKQLPRHNSLRPKIAHIFAELRHGSAIPPRTDKLIPEL